jgi:hypothetical protein
MLSRDMCEVGTCKENWENEQNLLVPIWWNPGKLELTKHPAQPKGKRKEGNKEKGPKSELEE